LIIIENSLPGMNGLRFLEELERRDLLKLNEYGPLPRVPVILAAKSLEQWQLIRAHQLGAILTLCKPTSNQQAARGIEQLIISVKLVLRAATWLARAVDPLGHHARVLAAS